MIPSVFRKKHALGPDPRGDTGFPIKIRAKLKRDPWSAWFSLRGLGLKEESIRRYYNPKALALFTISS